MTTAKLYWAFSMTHGFQVVFANHPVVGKLFMGVTMSDARKVASECEWCKE